MAFMKTLFFAVYLLSSLLLLHSIATHEGLESITLSLIHPFSVHSPFYPGKNVTDVEKTNLLIQATIDRMRHLFPMTTRSQGKYWNGSSEVDDIAATVLEYSGAYYVAKVGIGSFPPVPGPKWLTYYLIMDTGSHITWVQCEGCNPCFPLIQIPNFPFSRSQSYRSIPCGHRDCPTPREDCYGGSCGFIARYSGNDGPLTRGTIARETLTFPSDISGSMAYNNLFLACGLQNNNYRFRQPNKIAGLLGLGPGGRGTPPIWRQLDQKRFSYCLFTSEQTSSKLHIGEGARLAGPQIMSTPLLRGSNPSLYYVELQDISIAGIRLKLRGFFRFGGCVIDTGVPFTSIVDKAYSIVRIVFIRYFAQFGLQPYGSGSRPSGLPMFDLCFPRPLQGFRFPTMTFHFKGADLVVQSTGVFSVGSNYICVALRSGDVTLIGAYQQTQHKFSFDLELGNTGTLFFAPENCGAPV